MVGDEEPKRIPDQLYTRDEVEALVKQAVEDGLKQSAEAGSSLAGGIDWSTLGEEDGVREVALEVVKAAVRAGVRNTAGSLISFAFEVADAFEAEVDRRQRARDEETDGERET